MPFYQDLGGFYKDLLPAGRSAAVDVLEKNGFLRLSDIFPAVHPWIKAAEFSVMLNHSIRVGLLVLKIMSSGMLGAFFLSNLGTPDSDPECFPLDGAAFFGISLGVGLVSAFLGDLILFVIYYVQKKKDIEREEWSHQTKREQREKWHVKIMIFWAFACTYTAICCLALEPIYCRSIHALISSFIIHFIQ